MSRSRFINQRSPVLLTLLGLLLTLLALAAPARAGFPGANGKIALSRDVVSGDGMCDDEIDTINPEGTGLTPLTTSTSANGGAAWSSDGQRIAFERAPGTDCNTPGFAQGYEIWTMDANGSNQARLTNNSVVDGHPAWSPDGTKIAFHANRDGNYEIYVMNSDGSGQTRLTSNTALDTEPEWSPDGQKIVFARDLHIYTMNPDGTGQTQLTSNPPCGFDCFFDNGGPAWSPDGTKIVFTRDEVVDTEYAATDLWVMNRDGSNLHQLSNDHSLAGGYRPAWSPDGKKIADDSQTDVGVRNANGGGWTRLGLSSYNFDAAWQPIPVASYPHPQSGSQLSASLVPAFKQCGTAGSPSNAQHSPPLGVGSCTPTRPGSAVALVGASSQSSAQLSVTAGDTDPTNGNQADVGITANLSDIQAAAGGDYNPNASGADLTAVTRLRLTDKANGYGGLPATATEYDFKVPIDCSSTADPVLGATCTANTTANAITPGFIQEQRQTVVQTFRVRVDDSGANGVRGDSDDRIFATQGVYVP